MAENDEREKRPEGLGLTVRLDRQTHDEHHDWVEHWRRKELRKRQLWTQIKVAAAGSIVLAAASFGIKKLWAAAVKIISGH
jgi:hypothetical protein